jgi:hypothetical protein
MEIGKDGNPILTIIDLGKAEIENCAEIYKNVVDRRNLMHALLGTRFEDLDFLSSLDESHNALEVNSVPIDANGKTSFATFPNHLAKETPYNTKGVDKQLRRLTNTLKCKKYNYLCWESNGKILFEPQNVSLDTQSNTTELTRQLVNAKIPATEAAKLAKTAAKGIKESPSEEMGIVFTNARANTAYG